MQNDREQVVRLPRAADVNDSCAPKLLGKDVNDEFEHIIIERPESAVDQDPWRRLNQHARKYQAKLLVLTQFPVPAAGLIEQRLQSLHPQAKKRPREGGGIEVLCFQGIGEHFAQASARQIGRAARQIKNLLSLRLDDVPGPPGPQYREGAAQLGLAGSRRTEYQHPLSGLHDHHRLPEPIGMRRGDAFEIVDDDLSWISLRIDDAAFEAAPLIRGAPGVAKA